MHVVKEGNSTAEPKGESIPQCARHCQLPRLHSPRHWKYAAHGTSAAHAVDSAQQLVLTHEAHTLVPYGKPQRVEVRSSGGLSVIPTS
jgi:hypothetical protein